MDAEIHDRDDRADSRTARERLSGLLPVELDLRRIGHVSLLPAKVAVLREYWPIGEDTLESDATINSGVPDPQAIEINEEGDVVAVRLRPIKDSPRSTLVGRRFRLTGGCALCGDADANGRITAADSLASLRTSVGLGNCPLERCDADASEAVTAADALLILRSAVAVISKPLACA